MQYSSLILPFFNVVCLLFKQTKAIEIPQKYLYYLKKKYIKKKNQHNFLVKEKSRYRSKCTSQLDIESRDMNLKKIIGRTI